MTSDPDNHQHHGGAGGRHCGGVWEDTGETVLIFTADIPVQRCKKCGARRDATQYDLTVEYWKAWHDLAQLQSTRPSSVDRLSARQAPEAEEKQ